MRDKADKALSKAKVNLIINHQSAFLATVAFNLKYEWNNKIQTAEVNGITVFINEEFFLKSTEEQRTFVIAHEAWHVALNHLSRVTDKNKSLYNEAGDYVINQLLKDAGYQIYSWALQDNKYRNMSTNQVYDLLKKDPTPTKDSSNNKMSGDIKKSSISNQELESIVKNILVKASTQSKLANEDPGNIPNEIVRTIDKLLNPVLPWDSILDRFLTDMVKDDYTWRKPNKRFMSDIYMPTQYSPSLGHLTIAIDTSGSISKKQLTEILSEITFIKEKFKPNELTILDCDRKIHNIHSVTFDTEIQDLKFNGGGGTSFKPVIDYCKKHSTQALLYFTDLYAEQITEEQDFSVIWLCYSNHKEAPMGDTIYYET